MRSWRFPAVLVATLLAAGPARAGQEPAEVKLQAPAPDVIQSTLADLVAAGQPFELKAEQVVLADQAQLAALVPDPATLPPGSEVRIEGTLAGRPFEAKVETQAGQVEVAVEGVTFATPEALDAFLARFRNATEVKVEGFVVTATGEVQRVEAKLEQGKLEIEREGVGADKRHRGREGTSATLNAERARDRGKDDLHRQRGREGTSATLNAERARDRGRDALARQRGRDEAAVERPEPMRLSRDDRAERLERTERPE
ncbi:MAG TPA: hypothetical protein VNM66_07970, partial [Thermodesulfobacteriota bacterium]|nr:hypothetical protein [Thermodesulfobacteriota bacterium]